MAAQTEIADRKERIRLKRRYRSWPKRRREACPNYSTKCLYHAYQAELLTYGTVGSKMLDAYGGSSPVLREQDQPCTFAKVTLPRRMDVYAGGAYGGLETPHTIDESNHAATRFDVVVNSTRRPVGLLLGAYEPSVWEISWTEGTKISAVYVTGHYRQAVIGLHDAVPVINSSRENDTNCGYTYVAKSKLGELNPLSEKVFGQSIKEVQIANRGYLTLGKPLSADDEIVTSTDKSIESVIDPTTPREGMDGIADLLEKGAIRPMKEADYLRWARRSYRSNKDKYPKVVGESPLAPHKPQSFHTQAFLVTKKIQIPPGLAGANAVTFFLDDRVPYPKGFLAHSTLYNFNDMTCRGQFCGNH